MIHVTDTHPLVWLLSQSPRLSQTVRRVFHDPDAQIVIPTIVLVEIQFLYARNRTSVNLPMTLAHVAAATNCRIHPLDESVVDRIPTSLNIHDAIIVGTALTCRDVLGENVSLITKDAAITASGLVPVLW